MAETERCQTRLGERAECSGHLSESLDRCEAIVRRSLHEERNLRLEKVSTDFSSGSLQVLFAVVLPAGSRVESRASGMRRTPSHYPENGGRDSHHTLSSMVSVELGKSVMVFEELAI